MWSGLSVVFINATAGTSPASAESLDRLDSWKEISAYLKRGVTTVQRWEREEGLPVHRHQHDSLGSVYAFKHELEAWRVKRAVRADTDDRLTHEAAVIPNRRSPAWERVALGVGALLVAAGVGAISVRLGTPPTPKIVRRLTIVPPSTAPIVTNGLDRNLAITRDGTRIVYVGGAGAPRLFVRALDQLEAKPIVGLVSPRYPFISPDGQWIGFFEGFTSLKKVAITGGLATELTYVNSAGESGPRGATWGPDNQIAFAVGDRLLRVSADGGKPEVLAVADNGKGEAAYWWPTFLPDGRALLFTIVPSGDWSEKGSEGSIQNAQVAVLDLRTGKRKVLFEGGSHAQYLQSGHLVYAAGSTLRAVAFDLRKFAIVGTPKTVLPEVEMSRAGAADFDVARDGTLVYTPGDVQSDLVTLTWVDRHGHEEATGIPPFSYRYPRLSPDGGRVVFGSPRDLGIWDLSGRKLSWFGIGPTSYPVWTPDGQRLVFASTRAGAANIYQQVIDGTQPTTRLTESPHNQFPTAISPDGNHVVFREDAASSNLMLLDLTGKRRAESLIQTPFMGANADFSPDGRLVTFQSNESGQDEVYVQQFPNVAGKRWKVSSRGGTRPKWARNGHELFFVSPTGAMMSVPIQRQGATFTVGTASMLFEGLSYFVGGSLTGGRTYDVSPDDERFLMMKPVSGSGRAASGRNIEVVLNWYEELSRTVPIGK